MKMPKIKITGKLSSSVKEDWGLEEIKEKQNEKNRKKKKSPR